MAESNPSQQRPARPTCIAPAFTFLQIILSHAPNTTPLLAFLFIFFVSALTLLILTALALSATVLGFIFFMPLVLFTSPIWLPGCTLLFLTAAGFLLACGFGGAVAAGSTWMFRYFWGMHPPGFVMVVARPTCIAPAFTFLQKILSHAPNTTPLLAFLFIFFVSALTLLILTALALSVTVLGFIFFTPLVLFTSPIWLPGCTLLFLTAAGFLLACGFGGAVAAGSTWMFRYFWGMHPPGSNRVGSARTRIYDTASHVKDYVGYLQSKVRDVASGA
ncbi:hypothetical protein GOBAR_AA38020 [Gossypium barbadense]|uniref:Oleosin n=1 Tax=Gossypium barbadense TaxID=3634 RepID=A0A2P5VV39_GOSBA|nr:hypothetical protein GOBAR_AA38020 [Gossypium barbadense]